jgi:hypothetical protein
MLTVVTNELLRLRLECLTTTPGTKVEGLTLIVELFDGARAANLHATNRVLKAAFFFLPFHCLLLLVD